MKKKTIIIAGIILISLILYGIYSIYIKRTPEKFLKQMTQIDLKGFNYTVESFNEQWCPNGDGDMLISFKFSELTDTNIDYFKSFSMKSLPITSTDKAIFAPNSVSYYRMNEKGYYLYKENDVDTRDYYIFIVDTIMKKAIFYYQEM